MVQKITDTRVNEATSIEQYMEMAKKNRKEFIKAAVRGFAELYPKQYRAAVQRATELRQTRTNKFALAEKETELRFGASIPSGLYMFIKANLGDDFLEKKEMSWFLKTFPQFKVPEEF